MQAELSEKAAGQPEAEDCSIDIIPDVTKPGAVPTGSWEKSEGSIKSTCGRLLVPDVVSMTKYLCSNHRLIIYSYLNQCLKDGSLSKTAKLDIRDDLFSLCGLNCGLCGYRLQGHCNGCFKDSFCAKVCPMSPCSVKHGNIQYCFECPEYPCRHYEGFDSYDTLVLHRNQRKDMQKAKEIGIDSYHVEQREKKEILNRLLEAYDDGSKADFFCLSVNLFELKDLTEMLETADERTRGLTEREKAAFIMGQLKAHSGRDSEK